MSTTSAQPQRPRPVAKRAFVEATPEAKAWHEGGQSFDGDDVLFAWDDVPDLSTDVWDSSPYAKRTVKLVKHVFLPIQRQDSAQMAVAGVVSALRAAGVDATNPEVTAPAAVLAAALRATGLAAHTVSPSRLQLQTVLEDSGAKRVMRMSAGEAYVNVHVPDLDVDVVVEPDLRGFFTLGSASSPQYAAKVAALPRLYVGTRAQLQLLAGDMATALALNYTLQGLPPPLWRSRRVITHRWSKQAGDVPAAPGAPTCTFSSALSPSALAAAQLGPFLQPPTASSVAGGSWGSISLDDDACVEYNHDSDMSRDVSAASIAGGVSGKYLEGGSVSSSPRPVQALKPHVPKEQQGEAALSGAAVQAAPSRRFIVGFTVAA